MIPVYPLQVFRDRKPEAATETVPPQRAIEEVLGLGTETPGEPTDTRLRSMTSAD